MTQTTSYFSRIRNDIRTAGITLPKGYRLNTARAEDIHTGMVRLRNWTVAQLRKLAGQFGLGKGLSRATKAQLVAAIVTAAIVAGSIHADGFGIYAAHRTAVQPNAMAA